MAIAPKKLPTLRDSSDPEQVDIFQREVREIIRRLTVDSEGHTTNITNIYDGVGVVNSVTGVTPLTITPVVGDVVISLDDNGISNAKLRDSAALSVIGRATNTSGDPADIAAASNGHILGRASSTISFATPDTFGIPTGTGTSGRSTRWTGTSVLATGAFTDDGTNVSLGGALTLTPMTAGSVLFAGAGGVVSQDNANLFWDDAGNTLTVGAAGITKSTGGLLEVTRNAANARLVLSTYGTGVSSTVYLYHGRGTAAATTALQSGDGAGAFAFTGATGAGSTDFFEGASVIATTTENWSLTNNFGTKLDFRTTTNAAGSAGRAVRLTIDHGGSTIVYGRNTNTPSATGRAALELFTGRTSTHTLNANQGVGDIAIQHGGSGGGFRHWVSTKHAVTADTNNAIRFWVNNSATAEVSTLPGTGNTNVLDLYGDTSARFYGALTVDTSLTANTLTLGVTATQPYLQMADGSTAAVSAANTGRLRYLAANQAFQVSLNGAAYVGLPSGSGTLNTLPKWTPNGAVLGDSSITDDGTTVTVGGALTVTGNCTLGNAGTDTVEANLVLIRGNNTNPYSATRRAGLELHLGRDQTDALLAGQTVADIAFQYGGNPGGFRHWIATRHGTAATTVNAIRFFVNTSGTAEGSSLPGTGNVNVLDLYGDTSAKFYGALAVNGNTTLGDATATDLVTVNGRVSQSSTDSANHGANFAQTVSAGTTSGRAALRSVFSGTLDTTAASLTATAVDASISSTRSAGANDLINQGFAATVSGGQNNRCARFAVIGTGATNYGALITSTATGATNYGIEASSTGAGTTNIAGQFSASGAGTNFALRTAAGDNQFNTTSGTSYFGQNTIMGLVSGTAKSRLQLVGSGGVSSVTPTAATLLTLENAGSDVTASLLSTTNTKRIAFGNSSGNQDGFIDYDTLARGLRLGCAGVAHWTLSSTGVVTHVGSVIQTAAQGGGVPAHGTTNTGSAVAGSYISVRGRVDGTFDATAADRTNDGVQALAYSTRSAGGNSVINRGLFADAASGQFNYAVFADRGDNLLNVTSGSTGIGYASKASLPAKLSVTGTGYFSSDLELDGALNHDGTTVGFYGTAPVTQATLTALTDNTAGTANDTVQALTDPADTPASADALRDDLVANLIPELRNNFADLTAKVNAIRTVLDNLGLTT